MATKKKPMWASWNAKHLKDRLPAQNIGYLTQISHSPTSMAVVAETLHIAQKIAAECNQRFISVTFDLAIAKMTFSIQAEESPRYNDVFIHLGSFHIELLLFKALGDSSLILVDRLSLPKPAFLPTDQ